MVEIGSNVTKPVGEILLECRELQASALMSMYLSRTPCSYPHDVPQL